MGLKGRIDWELAGVVGFVLVVLAVMGAWTMAGTTYTAPDHISSRPTNYLNRYAAPVEGLIVVDVVTDDVNDVSVAIDPQLCGYLERVTYHTDGNAPAWKLTIRDADGFAIFADAECNGVTDPCSLAVSHSDAGSTEFRGVPFWGGLTVAIADANQDRALYAGDGNNVTVRMYIREAWRR